jgi:hypothetical protein
MKVALLIGCNYAGSSIELKGCINDVILMKKILINNFGFLSENIIEMRDDLAKTNPLYPTNDNILNQLNLWVNRSNTNAELLYFHYSGHGSAVSDSNGDEGDRRDEVIIPTDYLTTRKYILDDQINSILSSAKDTCPIFLGFDCCNSGTSCDLPLSYYYLKNKFTQRSENSSTKLVNKNILCLSACTDIQSSLDVNNGGVGNGAFTLALSNSLAKYGYTNVPISTLISGIYLYLINNAYNGMSPVVSTSKTMDLTKTIFMKTNTTTPTTNVLPASPSVINSIKEYLNNQITSKAITKAELIILVNSL